MPKHYKEMMDEIINKMPVDESNLRYSVKFAYKKGGKIANAFYKNKPDAEKFMKAVIAKGGKAILTTEDAPANAVAHGGVDMAPNARHPLTKSHNKYQKKNKMGADGLCGPSTFRVIYNERMADLEDYRPVSASPGQKFIICNGDYFEIDWPKVKLFFEGDGMKLSKGYRKHSGERNPSFFVCHWDVCLSSKSCHKVLQK